MKLWEDNPAMFTLFLIAPTIISNAIILSKKTSNKNHSQIDFRVFVKIQISIHP